ncbi:MAG TPA: tripartite tricarboxylate transporter substrate binding protein [Acetobacteraceae bacterium]|nr:tripartite tricarboxylate transporter substrate binding protein [Acetobacteraceae bacterium]
MLYADRSRSSRRALMGGGAAALLPLPALAQGAFPERSIRLYIPWPPGASADVFLRALADQAGRRLGQLVVPENRPGASGTLGAAALKDARPDGYTLAQIHTGVFRFALAAERPTYDPLNDFTFILQLSGSVHGIVVRSDSPWRNIQEFLAHVRANPGRVTYGTLGPTSIQHITMVEIMQRLGIQLEHVPYRGGGELYTGLMSRQVDAVADASGWAPIVQDGQFRLLVVWGSQRMARFPDVPTLREAGIPMEVNSPYGLGGPRGMDPVTVVRLHDAFREALFDPATRAVMERFNMPNHYLNTSDYDAASRRQHEIERENLRRIGMLRS